MLLALVGGALPRGDRVSEFARRYHVQEDVRRALKIAVRASQSAEEALQKDGIVQAVQAVDEKLAEEKPSAEHMMKPWMIQATHASRRC